MKHAKAKGKLAELQAAKSGTNADVWSRRIEKLFKSTRLLGNYFATDHVRLREIARACGKHHIDNVATVLA